ADARLLIATERGMRRISVIAVGPYATGLDSAAHAICARAVAGPHARAKTIERVIGDREGFSIIFKRRHRDNGPEDFLLEHAHLVVTFKHCRLDVEAAGKLTTEVCAMTTRQNAGTLAFADLDVAQDLLELVIGSLCADHRRSIHRMALLDLHDTLK